MILFILGLLIGAYAVLLGYYARDLHDKVNKLYEQTKDWIERPSGVVRPIPTDIGRQDQSAKTSETGGIRPPNPQEYAAKEIMERNKIRV